MPELPEVETIRRGLEGRLTKKRITSVAVKKPKLIRGPVLAFQKALVGQTITAIDRRGKLLAFRLGRNATPLTPAYRQAGWPSPREGRGDIRYLLVHLKMTGQLIYRFGRKTVLGGHGHGMQPDELPNKYSYIIFSFTDGSQLFFNDQRQFGYMRVVNAEEKAAIWQAFGIDPMDRRLYSWERFRAALKKRKTTLKAALLNQAVIAGIGNIYADEICFAAKVKPQRRISTLTEAELKMLYRESLKIIAAAVRARGTTFSNYRDDEGKLGGFRKLLKVYGRGGEACVRPACRQAGVVLKKIRAAGRGTVYCAQCQA